MNFWIVIGFLLFSIGLFSCKENMSDLNDYLAWVNEHKEHLSDSDSVDDLLLAVEYLPTPIMALREVGDVETLKKEYSNLTKNYEGTEFYEIKISSLNQSTRKSLQKRFAGADTSYTAFEQYANFGVQDDIKLIIDQDTLPCSYLHREISDPLTNIFKYTVAFEPIQDKGITSVPDRKILISSASIQIQTMLIIPGHQIASLPTIKTRSL